MSTIAQMHTQFGEVVIGRIEAGETASTIFIKINTADEYEATDIVTTAASMDLREDPTSGWWYLSLPNSDGTARIFVSTDRETWIEEGLE